LGKWSAALMAAHLGRNSAVKTVTHWDDWTVERMVVQRVAMKVAMKVS